MPQRWRSWATSCRWASACRSASRAGARASTTRCESCGSCRPSGCCSTSGPTASTGASVTAWCRCSPRTARCSRQRARVASSVSGNSSPRRQLLRSCPMALPIRPGLTVPLPGHLHTHREQLHELADLGYTDIWSAEADGGDGLTPLALAAAWEPRLRLGTAILPAFTRSPALMAQSAAAMADAAPGRFALGIGTSSDVIVERWNGVPFVEPYKKVRDMV